MNCPEEEKNEEVVPEVVPERVVNQTEEHHREIEEEYQRLCAQLEDNLRKQEEECEKACDPKNRTFTEVFTAMYEPSQLPSELKGNRIRVQKRNDHLGFSQCCPEVCYGCMMNSYHYDPPLPARWYLSFLEPPFEEYPFLPDFIQLERENPDWSSVYCDVCGRSHCLLCLVHCRAQQRIAQQYKKHRRYVF